MPIGDGVHSIPGLGVIQLRTSQECLAKSLELNVRAAACSDEVAQSYRDLSERWRLQAKTAAWQDGFWDMDGHPNLNR
jgi:hypothetical protein